MDKNNIFRTYSEQKIHATIRQVSFAIINLKSATQDEMNKQLTKPYEDDKLIGMK